MSSRSNKIKARMIGGLGILLLVLGYVPSPVIPIVMKMWTTSYGLVSAAWACLMFLLFFWFVAIRGHRKWSLGFVVIGMNPIFIYMATSILPIHELVGILTNGIAGTWGPLDLRLTPCRSWSSSALFCSNLDVQEEDLP